MNKEKSILEQAHDIVFERGEEKSRMYGEFIEGMEQSARIASELSRKEITTFDMYNCMLALKLSRASWNYREDNYLDLVAYAASLNEYQKQQKEKQNEDTKVASSKDSK
jgi:hypothetical protein